ncbi:MAG: hypothetical protein Kow00122_09010 [Thermoleophilia bacterium]
MTARFQEERVIWGAVAGCRARRVPRAVPLGPCYPRRVSALRRHLFVWGPLVVWLGVIAVTSTELGARSSVDIWYWRFLHEWLPQVFGWEPARTTPRFLPWWVRKGAHVTEYAVLAVLARRALRRGVSRLAGWTPAAVLGLALLVAGLDEWHQSFLTSRTGTGRDVVFDFAGAVVGAAGAWFVSSRGQGARGRLRRSVGRSRRGVWIVFLLGFVGAGALLGCSGAGQPPVAGSPSLPSGSPSLPSGSPSLPSGSSATSSGSSATSSGSSTTSSGSLTTSSGSSPTAPVSSAPVAPRGPSGSALTALLTPADVERVSGLSEVRRAGRNPDKRLGGDLNFVRPDGTPLLMVVLEPAQAYADWRADPDSFREDLPGLGEAAFIGPSRTRLDTPYLVVVRSGSWAVGLFTFDNPDAAGWNNLLTLDQLQALARVVIGRL